MGNGIQSIGVERNYDSEFAGVCEYAPLVVCMVVSGAPVSYLGAKQGPTIFWWLEYKVTNEHPESRILVLNVFSWFYGS